MKRCDVPEATVLRAGGVEEKKETYKRGKLGVLNTSKLSNQKVSDQHGKVVQGNILMSAEQGV